LFAAVFLGNDAFFTRFFDEKVLLFQVLLFLFCYPFSGLALLERSTPFPEETLICPTDLAGLTRVRPPLVSFRLCFCVPKEFSHFLLSFFLQDHGGLPKAGRWFYWNHSPSPLSPEAGLIFPRLVSAFQFPRKGPRGPFLGVSDFRVSPTESFRTLPLSFSYITFSVPTRWH